MNNLRYSGFWWRVLASAIDGLLFIPVLYLHITLFNTSRWTAMLTIIITHTAGHIYFITMHQRLGQTLGKMAAGLKVTRMDGSPIGFREAFLRQAVYIGFSVITVTCGMYVLATWTGEWSQLSYIEKIAAYEQRNLSSPWTTYAYNTWLCGTIIILLANHKRRAPHDYIAGTVVLNLRPQKSTLPTPALAQKR